MSALLDLGGFQINLSKSIKELKQDIKDDWFPDPIKWDDCLNADVIQDYFNNNLNQNHGFYVPEKAEAFNVPKKGFLVRYSLETNVFDRLIFLALISEIIPHYDELLSPNSLSHRYNNASQRSSKYLFKPGVDQYKSFEGLIKVAAAGGKTVLITDVFNYYENIQIEQLKSCLERKIPSLKVSTKEKVKIRRIIDLLSHYLQNWSYNGKNGLPQNRDASSFLANILMDDVDKEMESRGFKYFRYMDDIRIVCDNEQKARLALKYLSESLRSIGLNLNPTKTKIGKITDREIKESFINLDRKLESLDNMWKSRSLEVIKKSLPYLKEYTVKLIETGSTGDRGFRFAIKRIENSLGCEQLEIPPTYFNEITDKIISELENNPSATDTYVKYLAFVHLSDNQVSSLCSFLCNPDRSIYSWQNYRIWMLLILRDVNRADLLKYASDLLESSGDSRLPDRAGAKLYLGKFGSTEDRKKIAQLFPKIASPWLQRQTLIAVHELKYRDGIDKIAEHSVAAVKGTYKRLNDSGRKGIYALPPEKNHYKDLYDEASIYD